MSAGCAPHDPRAVLLILAGNGSDGSKVEAKWKAYHPDSMGQDGVVDVSVGLQMIPRRPRLSGDPVAAAVGADRRQLGQVEGELDPLRHHPGQAHGAVSPCIVGPSVATF